MNTQIYEEASDWIVKNRGGDLDAQEKKSFDAWLRESPQNLRAYLEMSSVWEDVASIDPGLNVSADELIARARAEENIVPLESPSILRARGSAETSRRQRTTPARGQLGFYRALAASVLLTLAGTWLYGQRNTYSTGVGEQRSIVLNDGSTVELNSRSRVRVRFSDAERDVDLIEGQALFRVAKNPIRPFIVSAAGAYVRAVGTQFDVYRKRSSTVITVVEGKVAVFGEPHPPSPSSNSGKGVGGHVPSSFQDKEPSTLSPRETADGRGFRGGKGEAPARVDSPDGAIFLAAGEQLTVTPASAAPLPRRANLAAATAWTQRSLIFDSSPLTEVVEEFNRYNSRQLIIEDPELAAIHVSGMFSSVDPTLLLRFLRTQPELAVQETQREIRISRR
ncbi:MAG TPA: FecR domain-containing protein [Steroidobacteraceae bacterium]|nr:FecR domain-containing protein [Steroidobacteraceae bacterium]